MRKRSRPALFSAIPSGERSTHDPAGMAKSRFEYVRTFELPDPLLQGTFIVVRIDGRGFHKYGQDSDLLPLIF